ncbi:protein of unknown function (plasmid) [Caballeronia sp. S22]
MKNLVHLLHRDWISFKWRGLDRSSCNGGRLTTLSSSRLSSLVSKKNSGEGDQHDRDDYSDHSDIPEDLMCIRSFMIVLDHTILTF